MTTTIKLTDGTVLNVPKGLYEVVQTSDSAIVDISDHSQILKISKELDNPATTPSRISVIALTLAQWAQQHSIPEEVILYWGIYVVQKAKRYTIQGKPEDGLSLLIDILQIEHLTLAHCPPKLTLRLTEQLIRQTEEAIHFCAAFGSVTALSAHLHEVETILDIISAIWEPSCTKLINSIQAILPSLTTFSLDGEQQRLSSSKLMNRLIGLKQTHFSQKIRRDYSDRNHFLLLEGLASAWLEMVQQELILSATAEYSSTGLNTENVILQVQQLTEKVEKRLRIIVASKYAQQYGSSWQHHIMSKHKEMYARWQWNIKQDKNVFNTYQEYTPDILDYSGFNDMKELITAQWHLFKDIFDFGYGRRNKAVFFDKTTHIIKVRNPLAHHRNVPENELLRAKVLCTDILLALDQAGEGVESATE